MTLIWNELWTILELFHDVVVQTTLYGYKLSNSIVVEARSWHACITWFFVNKVQNIKLNKGLLQKYDARDTFCISKLFYFDKTSLESA